jgi:hypothetical protein
MPGWSRELLITVDSMRAGEAAVFVDLTEPKKYKTVNMGTWQKQTFDEVRVENRMLTTSVITPLWSVNVTSKPIYALVAPFTDLDDAATYHGRWSEFQRRLDISVHGFFPQPEAHGIIGQSYRDATVRNGKLDEYGIESVVCMHAISLISHLISYLPHISLMSPSYLTSHLAHSAPHPLLLLSGDVAGRARHQRRRAPALHHERAG